LLFKHKDSSKTKLHVDLGDLQNEKEHLISFLQSHLKGAVSEAGDKVAVEAETVPMHELLHAVNKFVYHRDLNATHWVSVEGSTVKINRFKGADKKKEAHKKKEPPHQSVTQSWGL
jgi:hypothetical protein